jgi:cytochrome c553
VKPASSALTVIVALVLVSVAGCGEDPIGLAGPPDAGRRPDTSEDGGPGALPSGVPCEVAVPLSTYCTTCHGATPTEGALMPLVTLENLMAPSVTMPSRTVIDLALERMQSTTMPMPPAGARMPDTDIAAIQAWVDTGMPAGSCDIYDPFAEPEQCTTGTMWLRGNFESPEMRPGGACITCHTEMRRGPRPPLTLAGTVYQTGHEPADCNGVDGFAVDYAVEVTDAAGNVITMLPNSVGNFMSQAAVTFPITARVYQGDRERRMVTPSMSGDCNSCHTQSGDMMAPGRIAMP